MKRIVKLTERDLTRIVKRVMMEQDVPMETPSPTPAPEKRTDKSSKINFNVPKQKFGDFMSFNKMNTFKFADRDNLIIMNQGKEKYVATDFKVTGGDMTRIPVGEVLEISKWNPQTKQLMLSNGMTIQPS